MPRIAAVLFDIDGTLVDSNESHVSAWQQAFRESGHEIASDVIRRQIGKGADQLIPALLPGATDATGDGKRIAARHGELFKQHFLPRVQPFPEAADLIAELHAAGIEVALASSASAAEVDAYVQLLGIAGCISARTASDDVEHTKPAGDIFAAALAKIPSVDPSRVVVVGDTPYDVEAAARCGLATVAVLSGGFDEAWLRRSGAVAVYRDAAALRADSRGKRSWMD